MRWIWIKWPTAVCNWTTHRMKCNHSAWLVWSDSTTIDHTKDKPIFVFHWSLTAMAFQWLEVSVMYRIDFSCKCKKIYLSWKFRQMKRYHWIRWRADAVFDDCSTQMSVHSIYSQVCYSCDSIDFNWVQVHFNYRNEEMIDIAMHLIIALFVMYLMNFNSKGKMEMWNFWLSLTNPFEKNAFHQRLTNLTDSKSQAFIAPRFYWPQIRLIKPIYLYEM